MGRKNSAYLFRLRFTDLHSQKTARFQQRDPMLSNGPIEEEAVLAAVQGHGGLPEDLRLELGKLFPLNIGRVGGNEIQSAVGES